MSSEGLNNNATPPLVVPPTSIARHPETIVKPRELRNWLATLPVTDTLQQAEQLHRQLKLLVRDPRIGFNAAPLLSLYHPALQDLQGSVWKGLVGAGHSLTTPEPLRVIVSQLMLEVACGYMRLINERLDSGSPPEADHVYHAMLPLCRLLQWDLLQYNLVRPSIWRQVLQVYAIGEFYDLNGRHHTGKLNLPEDARTSHGVFFSTLIMLLCDPYRLTATQVAKLIKGLGKCAEYLRINTRGEANYRIPVDMSGRLPPLRYARLQSQQQASEQSLQLDEFLLQFDRQGIPGDDSHMAQWLIGSLRDLALKPKGKEARRHPRHKHEAGCHFVHGLEQIHKRLTDNQDGSLQASARRAASSTGIILDDGTSSQSAKSGTPCRQLDYSLNGVGFMLSSDNLAPPVGAWVLLEADQPGAGTKGKLIVGRVKRRLKFDDQGTEIGLEKLQGEVIPVTFGLDQKPALLHINRATHLFEVIASAGTYTGPGQQTLKNPEQDFTVMLEELLETGSTDVIRVTLA